MSDYPVLCLAKEGADAGQVLIDDPALPYNMACGMVSLTEDDRLNHLSAEGLAATAGYAVTGTWRALDDQDVIELDYV